MMPLPPAIPRILFTLTAFLAAGISAQDAVDEGPGPDWRGALERAYEEGDFDGAVLAIEEYLGTRPDDAEAHRAHGAALERLVLEGGVTWLAMTDARDAWDRALALEPYNLETVRGAVAIRRRLGEYETAAALAMRLVGTATLETGTAPAEILALAVQCRISALQNATELDPAERLRRVDGVLTTIAGARRLVPGDTALATIEAAFLGWLGHPERAAQVLAEALESHTEESALHRALIDIHLRQGVEQRLAALYEKLGTGATNATLAWYTGYVARLEGDLALRERRHAEARAAYARCSRWMEVAATLEPDFEQSADQIRHQADLSTAWCAVDARENDVARRRLIQLLKAAPERRHERDGLGRSLLHALSAVGERSVQANDFRTAAEDARVVVAVAPDEGEWWNNLGFLLREHATQIEGGFFSEYEDVKASALEVYRQSWSAYRRAAELIPDDVRVVNDAALIQVYHVFEELELAEQMLKGSVVKGNAQLAELGPNPDEAERFPIGQAVGDAYQNLGYLNYHVYKRPAEARPWFVEAMNTDGGDRSDLDAYLVAIDTDAEELEERDSISQVSAPRAAQVAASIPWESSLEEARTLAREQQRPLVIYYRGDGLGLDVPDYDREVRGEAFAAATRGALLVIGDKVRRTYYDRRRDGRRILAPNWGAVSCREHIAAAVEFDAWYEESFGEAPGEDAEGLHLLLPGAEKPVRTDLEELTELFASGAGGEEDEGPPPFEAIEAALAGAAGRNEALELVRIRTRRARERVEKILWNGFRGGPAQEYLVAALAADDHESSQELLGACVRQTGNPLLARAALAVWPEGADLTPVWFAARWALEANIRDAAWEVLSRSAPEDLAVGARPLVGR